ARAVCQHAFLFPFRMPDLLVPLRIGTYRAKSGRDPHSSRRHRQRSHDGAACDVLHAVPAASAQSRGPACLSLWRLLCGLDNLPSLRVAAGEPAGKAEEGSSGTRDELTLTTDRDLTVLVSCSILASPKSAPRAAKPSTGEWRSWFHAEGLPAPSLQAVH